MIIPAMTIRAMIVDDEEHARNELKYLLEQYADINIVYQASNSQDALGAIQTYKPHLVFMDIEMPGMNGIKAAEKVISKDLYPLIVFSTAHEEFAAKAFEIDAIDYILKPYSARRLDRCINRVRTLLANSSVIGSGRVLQTANQSKQRLAIENNGKAIIINTSDIIVACCEDGQISIYTDKKVYQSNITLQELQARLEQNSFFRSHRAYLVNIEKVREVIPWFNSTFNLVLEGLPDMEIPVSRQQACHLKKIFDL